MDNIDIVLAKIADFDAKTKSGAELAQAQAYPNSLQWRLIQEANRLIDDAYWNDIRNDIAGALYFRYLSQAYIDLAKGLVSNPPQ